MDNAKSMGSEEHCCFSACNQPVQSAALQVRVWPPSDAPPVDFWGHDTCFQRGRDPAVDPDPVEEYGHIPTRAQCVFCGRQLPMVGVHPFVIEVGRPPAVDRFWAHANCIRVQIRGLSE